tara:strand:- start:88 stop:435 length:348 start_codon:yes stop_codon:yes gene_type:complete
MSDTTLHEIDIDEICETVESINITEVKENILLDMSNQLKEKFDKIEYLEKGIRQKHKTLIRKVLVIYGLIKAVDKISNENVELPIELQSIIDILNDTIEDFLEQEFFPPLFLLHD